MTIEELSKLSDEELRVRCAELCGVPLTEKKWRFRVWGSWSQGYHSEQHARGEMEDLSRYGHIPLALEEYEGRTELPNYPADLNAIAEAVRSQKWSATQEQSFQIKCQMVKAHSGGFRDTAQVICLFDAQLYTIAFIAVMQSA